MLAAELVAAGWALAEAEVIAAGVAVGGVVVGGGLLVAAAAAALYSLQSANPKTPPRHTPTGEAAVMCPKPEWFPEDGFHWAVVGQSGAGKSTFIHAILDKDPGDKADVVDCTKEPIPYKFEEPLPYYLKPFPNLKKICLWDCPGAGTPSVKRDTYVEDMGLRYMDGVIIIAAQRFYDTDLMLINEMKKFQVPYYLVYNKVDQDIQNEWEKLEDQIQCECEPTRCGCELGEETKEASKKKTMEKIKNTVLEQVGHEDSDRIHLVSAKRFHATKKIPAMLRLNFMKLIETILGDMKKAREPPLPVQCTPSQGFLELVDVTEERRMYWENAIKSTACSKCPDVSFGNLRIHKVTQVQNPELQLRYNNYKAEMASRDYISALHPPVSEDFQLQPDIKINEIRAFHGTSPNRDLIKALAKQGLDPRVVGENNMYGAGIYFSSNACKAMQYTNPQDRDRRLKTLGPESRFLLICRVILGEPFYPNGRVSGDMRRPPCDRGCQTTCTHSRSCDSVVANPGVANSGRQHHQEFVVFDRGQVYPEFIIEFSGQR